MTLITNSEMAAWKRCPRNWLITYYLGFVPARVSPVGSAPLGIWVHTALEGLYGYRQDPLVVLNVLHRKDLLEYPEHEAELLKQKDMAATMIEGYLEWAEAEAVDAGIEVVATEMDLRVPLPLHRWSGAELRCRLDQQVVDTSTGFRRFLDHKTADGFEAHHILELNPQFKTYALAQHLASGVPVGQLPEPGQPVVTGGYINTLRRVKRTARAKPPFYQRDPVNFNPEQLLSHFMGVVAVADEIMTARNALDWIYRETGGDLDALNAYQRTKLRPVPIPHDCSWRCPLASGLCVSMDDGSDWGGMLASGRWVRADPYAHYEHGGIASIRDLLGPGTGSLSTGR
jgi:hypothetical protein